MQAADSLLALALEHIAASVGQQVIRGGGAFSSCIAAINVFHRLTVILSVVVS